MPRTRKVFVKTFGCQMNVYDSERMIEALAPYGYQTSDRLDDADVVILNTCHIREKAAEKVYSELGRIRKVKEQRRIDGHDTVVTVAGCVAQAEGAEITRRAPVVDIVVGPQSYHHLPDLLFRAKSESRHLVDTSFPDEDKFANLPARDAPKTNTASHKVVSPAAAFLTIQEGCDKFCTFCVVPYTRGMEYSRPVEKLEEEARSLVARGASEVTLLGQNVNAYHGEGPDGRTWSLANLISRLAEIDGIERLRYMTSHAYDMTDDLIEAHRTVSKLMPYLHLPFQAGADRILAAMNRKHTVQEYRDVVKRIRDASPDLALSTDIIVGFPGETADEFEQTLDLVREIGFAQSYSFKFSARPGTPAATMDAQVSEEVKSERLSRLQALLVEQQSNFNADCVGKTFPVLFERQGRHEGELVGRSPYLQLVHTKGAEALLGCIMPVEISAASSNSLTGIIQAA